jgi:hypothetical protein
MVAGKLTGRPVTEAGWMASEGGRAVLGRLAEDEARALLAKVEPVCAWSFSPVAHGGRLPLAMLPEPWAALADALAAFVDGGLYECEGCGMRLEASGLDAATSAHEGHPLALVVAA